MSGTVQNLNILNASLSSNDSGKSNIGFLAGYLSGTVSNCFISGEIGAFYPSYAGGLIGRSESGAVIENCTVSLSSYFAYGDYQGGLVGYCGSSNISGCSVYCPDITVTENYFGGCCGSVEDGSVIADCSFSGTIDSGINNNTGGFAGAVTASSATVSITNCSFNGSFSNEASTSGGFAGSMTGSSSNRISINSCNVSGTLETNGMAGGITGDADYVDFDDCTISHLSIDDSINPNNYVGGMVGDAKDCSFDDITINSLTITGNGSTDYVGGMAGNAMTCSISNSAVSDLSISGADNRTGGFIGYCESSTLSSCSVSDVGISSSGDNVGGLIGQAEDTTLSDCRVAPGSNTISGFSCTGGLVGNFSAAGGDSTVQIASCIVDLSSATVSGNESTGGLIGYYHHSEAKDFYMNESCVSGSGKVESLSSYAGGFIGFLSGDSSNSGSLTFNKCYAHTDVSAVSDSGGFLGLQNSSSPGLSIRNSYYRGKVVNNINEFKTLCGMLGGETASHGIDFYSSYVVATTGTEPVGFISVNYDANFPDGDCCYEDGGFTVSDSAATNYADLKITIGGWDGSVWGFEDSVINSGYPYLKDLASTYD